MANSLNITCSWWIEQDDNKLIIRRVKNNRAIRFAIEGIVSVPTSETNVKVKTIHPDYGYMEKELNLKDFQCKKNELSVMMETFLDTGEKFVNRYNHLFPANNVSKISKGDASQPLPDNCITDSCEMEAIKVKRVKFGNDTTIEVPVSLLSSPPPQRLVRQLNQPHVQELKVGLKRHGVVFNNLNVHIPNHLACHIKKEDLLAGLYPLETIGGNHTRQALVDINYSSMVPVMVYAGLTNDQALLVGYEHNRLHHNSRVMTFREDLLLFRRKLVGDPDHGLSQDQRKKWRQCMSAILGLSVKEIRMKYRIHTFLAGQTADIWSLIDEVMKSWEQKSIKGQPSTLLKPSTFRFLEGIKSREEMKATLSKLLSGEITLKQARCNTEMELSANKRKKHRSTPQELETEDHLKDNSSDLDERENKLKKKEDDLKKKEDNLKDWEQRLVEWEKVLQKQSMERDVRDNEDEKPMEVESVEEPSTCTSSEEHTLQMTTKELKMPAGGVCSIGDWIAVFYSKAKVPPVGKIVDIDPVKMCATVHFLKGRKLSTTDIQLVECKYMICIVNVVNNVETEQMFVTDSKHLLEEKRNKYLELF